MAEVPLPEKTPTFEIPADALITVFSDTHLGWRKRNELKLNFLIGLIERPSGIVVINGDLGDFQFGTAAEMVGTWERLFNAIHERHILKLGSVRVTRGNHDDIAYWGDVLDQFLPPECQHERIRLQAGNRVWDIQHGDAILPAFHQRHPWLPVNNWLMGVVSLHGGTAARKLLGKLHLSDGLVPHNEPFARWATENLGENAVGLFGHTHQPVVDPGKRMANSGSLGSNGGEYLQVEGEDIQLIQVRYGIEP